MRVEALFAKAVRATWALRRTTPVLVFVLAGLLAGPAQAQMRQNASIQGCSNVWGAVSRPDAASCYTYCTQNAANACEWRPNGNCRAMFGTGCYVERNTPPYWAALVTAPPTTPIGWLEGADAGNGGRIQGWALNLATPSTSIDVYVYFDAGTPQVRAYTVPTNVSRPDVNALYGVGGNHGYDFVIPAVLFDGAQHRVDVYASGGGNPLLLGSPKYFTHPPLAPTLVSPRGVSTYDAAPALYWNAATGATQYWVQVDNVADPGAPVRAFQALYTTAQVCSGATCGLVPGTGLVAGPYTWNVEAQNAGGKTWGSGASFTVLAPPGPGLVSPRGDLSITTPTFGWTASVGATRYWLAVWNDAGAVAYQGPFDASVCAGSSCTAAPGKVFTAGAYSWNVQAQSPAGKTWGGGASFSLVTPPPPSLVAPNGSASPTPTFQWNAVPGATSYQLAVDTDAGTNAINATVAAASVCSGTTCSYAPGTLLYIGSSYTWVVRSINAVGEGHWSGRLGFTVAGPPTLVSPNGSIAEPNPTYTWRPVAGATQYFLALDEMVDGAWTRAKQVLADAASVCSASTCATTTAKTLVPGEYRWSVQAKSGPGGAVERLDELQYRRAPAAVARRAERERQPDAHLPVECRPGGDVLPAGRRPGGGPTVVNVTVAAASVCAGSTCSYAPGTLLYIGSSYTWVVRSINAVGKGDWSGRLGFTVAGTPTLVSPSGSTVVPSPTYTWMPVAGATQYFLALDEMVDGSWTRAGQVLADAASICSASTCATDVQDAAAGPVPLVRGGEERPGRSLERLDELHDRRAPAAVARRAERERQPDAHLPVDGRPGGDVLPLAVDPAEGAAVVNATVAAASVCAGSTCSYAPGTLLYIGSPYTWVVRSINAVGAGRLERTAGLHGRGPADPRLAIGRHRRSQPELHVEGRAGGHPVLPRPGRDGGRRLDSGQAGPGRRGVRLLGLDVRDPDGQDARAGPVPVVGAGEERPGRGLERLDELQRRVDRSRRLPERLPGRRLQRRRPDRPALLAGGHDERRPLDGDGLREPGRVAGAGDRLSDRRRLQR